MRKLACQAAIAAVVCLAVPANASAPIKGTTVKGGHNPSSKRDANQGTQGNSSGGGASHDGTKTGMSKGMYEWMKASFDIQPTKNGHAINTKGTGSVRMNSHAGSGSGNPDKPQR